MLDQMHFFFKHNGLPGGGKFSHQEPHDASISSGATQRWYRYFTLLIYLTCIFKFYSILFHNFYSPINFLFIRRKFPSVFLWLPWDEMCIRKSWYFFIYYVTIFGLFKKLKFEWDFKVCEDGTSIHFKNFSNIFFLFLWY